MKSGVKKATVFFPNIYKKNNYIGEIFGYFHSSSNIYNIIYFSSNPNDNNKCNFNKLGCIYKNFNEVDKNNTALQGYWIDQELNFSVGGVKCKSKAYDLVLDVFSRNTGILETDLMLDKGAIISGLGSVGSLVATELARSGIGKFLLIDDEIIEYHNLCRHQCGIYDVGNFKVLAVKEKILQINPNASVFTEISSIETVPKNSFDTFINKNIIIIGCADNREGDLYANRIANIFKIPFVSIGFWERACAGEIFYSIPGYTPCYECLFGKANTSLVTNRVSTNKKFYTNEEDLKNTIFEPGISVDINFITLIGIKIVLDLLNKKTKGYSQSVLNYLKQFTLICNSTSRKIESSLIDIFTHPLQITSSIEVDFNKKCKSCKLLNLQ